LIAHVKSINYTIVDVKVNLFVDNIKL